ncbi:MAG: hypothetical protein AB1637_07135 [Elusimicrobiota bacterium]
MFSYYKRLKKDLDFCAQEGITNKETADLIYDKIYSRKKKSSGGVANNNDIGSGFNSRGKHINNISQLE